MNRNYKIIAWLSCLLIIDRVIKYLILKSPLTDNGDFMFGLMVSPQLNNQLAFSLPLANDLIIIISGLAILGISWYLIKLFKQNSDLTFFWGLIMIGAVSNLWDRLAMGGVIDYLTLPFMPSLFNLSDAYILVGAMLLLIKSHSYLAGEKNQTLAGAKETQDSSK